MRKVLGRAISAATSLGALGWLLIIHGIPGFIDDTHEWTRWLGEVSEPLLLAIGIVGVLIGPLALTSDWWWPKVAARRWRSSTGEPPVPAVASSGEVAAFKGLAPLIGDLRDALRPDTDPTSRFAKDLDIGFRMALRGKEDDLLAHLDALQVPSPYGKSHKSVWYRYLIRLHLLSEDGDLDGARSLRVEDFDQ